jgi:hypothetical protein
MFIAEYQTQQIQNLYAFFAFAVSGVKKTVRGLTNLAPPVADEARRGKRSGR